MGRTKEAFAEIEYARLALNGCYPLEIDDRDDEEIAAYEAEQERNINHAHDNVI